MKRMSSTAWIVLFVWLLDTCCHVSATTRPIIGVLAQETFDDEKDLGDMYIPYNYIGYLESAGARVVPIKIGQTEDYYINLLKSINGVLFPGGGIDFATSDFYTKGKLIYDWAQKANDAGDYFPLWGTCQGFELLSAMTGGLDVLSSYRAEDVSLSLNFTKGYRDSKLFGSVPQDVEQYLKDENVTANFHQKGLSPKTYINNNELHRFYKVLSTNMDMDGKQFISTIEAYRYPFYGVQWHPEKNNYAWSAKFRISHSDHAVRVSQYMADFLVGESRKSKHTFPDQQTEVAAMIYNYSPTYSKSSSFSMNYYFKFKEHDFSQSHKFKPSTFQRKGALL